MSVPTSIISHQPAEQQPARWFAKEVQPHERSLRVYLRTRFPSLRDLDDLVQETYARLMRAHARGPINAPKSLLFTTARNTAFDIFRRQKIVSIEGMADLDRLSVLIDAPNAAEKASHSQEIELVKQAVRQLPERCRQVVTLRMIYGLSHREIAQRLGIAENTVNNQLSIGLERCRQYLSARGVTRSGLQ